MHSSNSETLVVGIVVMGNGSSSVRSHRMSRVSPFLAKLSARPMIFGEETDATAIATRLGFCLARRLALKAFPNGLTMSELVSDHSTKSPG
eukprot:1859692-Prymnesium_polylepis.1